MMVKDLKAFLENLPEDMRIFEGNGEDYNALTIYPIRPELSESYFDKETQEWINPYSKYSNLSKEIMDTRLIKALFI